ncbi:LysR family transcriptional regulator [Vibrio sp. JC009]|uniref:LysR family transcriptional regulator n=1 Tax=Vibrio sp. JC009 TaxID=2912314 RepID=UPI0023AFAC01|nr:LysR family transcriptional regulator [Vibrio sp. JC009]WED24892.1 LysR family transcriptional regulator [Vibrio sp. JC009]
MDKNYRYFLMVARYGSFKGAADALYISQPSLTVAMKKLETDMGVTLFNRHSKGVDLTEYGMLLKKHVIDLQEKHFHLMHQFTDMQQRQFGKIKLGTGEAWWELFVKNTVTEYQKLQPTSSFHLEFGNNLSLVHHLIQGDVDIVIGHEVMGLSDDARVVYTPLFQEQEAVYARKGHPLCSDKEPETKLHDFPLIRVTPNHDRHQSVLAPEHSRQERMYEHSRMENRICYDIDSLSASIDMVNMTHAVMPYTSMMKEWLEAKDIETVYINKEQIGNVGIYTKYGIRNQKVTQFIQLLQDEIAGYSV